MAINNKKLLDELGVDKLIELLKSYTTNSVNTVKHSLDPPYTVGEIPPITKGIYDYTRANRLMFLPADQIIVEQSIDGGVTWTSANASDDAKRNVFAQTRLYDFVIPLKDGIRSCDCMMRVTITGMKYNVPSDIAETSKYNYWNDIHVLSMERYCSLSGSFFWANAVSDYIHCKYEAATGANPNNWQLRGEGFIAGWSGLNYIKTTSGTFGGAINQTTNLWNHRYTFRTATIYKDFDNSKLDASTKTYHQSIMEISAFGDNVWSAPNYMMQNNHIYGWDINGNMTLQKGLYVTDYIQSSNRIVSPIYYEDGVALSNKYASRELVEDIQETMADYQDQFVAIGQEFTKMNVDVNCDHRYEITGNTGDEHGLAIDDQQMIIKKVQGRTLARNQLFDYYVQGTETSINAWTVVDNVYTFNYTNNTGKTQYENVAYSSATQFILGHKYAFITRGTAQNIVFYFAEGDLQAGKSSSTIFECIEEPKQTSHIILLCAILHGVTVSGTTTLELIDLTQAYGLGKEPTTIEEVLNDFSEYIPYDKGTFIHSTNKLISTGKNLFNINSDKYVARYRDDLSRLPKIVDNKLYSGGISGMSEGAQITTRLISNQNYTMSFDMQTSDASSVVELRLIKNVKERIYDLSEAVVVNLIYNGNGHKEINFNSGDYQTLAFIAYSTNQYGIEISNIQIEYGTTATPYEPYKEVIEEFVGDLKEWDYKDNQSRNNVAGTGELDLGTIDNWVYYAGYDGFYTLTLEQFFKENMVMPVKYNDTPYAITQRYIGVGDDTFNTLNDLTFTINFNGMFKVRNKSCNGDTNLLKQSLQGVKLLYKKKTPTITENYGIPAGMAVYKGGMQIQEGTIPYVIEKQYALSTKSQILQNIEIDREQQKQIDSLEHSVIEAYTKSTLVEYDLNKAIVDYELPYLKDRITASNSRIKALEDWSGTIVGGGSGTVDLSNYVTRDMYNQLSGEVTDLEEYIREVDSTVEGIQELVNDFNSDISTLYNLTQDLAQKEYPLDYIDYYVQEPNSAAIRLSHDVQINLYQIQGAFDIYLSGHRCILFNIPDDEITIYSDTSLSGDATVYNYANIPQSCFTWAAKSGIGFEGLRSAGINTILVEFVNNCFIIRSVYVGEI